MTTPRRALEAHDTPNDILAHPADYDATALRMCMSWLRSAPTGHAADCRVHGDVVRALDALARHLDTIEREN